MARMCNMIGNPGNRRTIQPVEDFQRPLDSSSRVRTWQRGYTRPRARERPRRIELSNRKRFFRATGFEIGNATGRAQRKLATTKKEKKERKKARLRSRSLPIVRCLRILFVLSFAESLFSENILSGARCFFTLLVVCIEYADFCDKLF